MSNSWTTEVIPCDVSLCANAYLRTLGSLVGSEENGHTLAARYITGGQWIPVSDNWYIAVLCALCVLASLKGCP